MGIKLIHERINDKNKVKKNRCGCFKIFMGEGLLEFKLHIKCGYLLSERLSQNCKMPESPDCYESNEQNYTVKKIKLVICRFVRISYFKILMRTHLSSLIRTQYKM